MQMLQKYGEQEDCEEYDVFHDNNGVNYAFFYDSPFDSSKDRDFLVNTLVRFFIICVQKSLSNQDASALMDLLNNRDKGRLQALFK